MSPTRYVGETESAAVITFYQNVAILVGAPALAGAFAIIDPDISHASLAFLAQPWVWPGTGDLLLMAACGGIAAAGMLLLAQAYRLASAGTVSVFEYSAILWGGALWGFLFIQEVPKSTTAFGALLICGAGRVALRKG